jgi:hypothetical protein
MANSNGAFGLRPYGILGSAPNSTGLTEYRIASDKHKQDLQGYGSYPYGGRGHRRSPSGSGWYRIYLGCV